jgi:hypothetical protein
VEFTIHSLVNRNCHQTNTDVKGNLSVSYIIVTIIFKISKGLVATHTVHGEKWKSKEILEYSVDIMETRICLQFDG